MQKDSNSRTNPRNAAAAASNIHDLIERMSRLVEEIKAEGRKTGYRKWSDDLPGMIERLEHGIAHLKRRTR